MKRLADLDNGTRWRNNDVYVPEIGCQTLQYSIAHILIIDPAQIHQDLILLPLLVAVVELSQGTAQSWSTMLGAALRCTAV